MRCAVCYDGQYALYCKSNGRFATLTAHYRERNVDFQIHGQSFRLSPADQNLPNAASPPPTETIPFVLESYTRQHHPTPLMSPKPLRTEPKQQHEKRQGTPNTKSFPKVIIWPLLKAAAREKSRARSLGIGAPCLRVIAKIENRRLEIGARDKL